MTKSWDIRHALLKPMKLYCENQVAISINSKIRGTEQSTQSLMSTSSERKCSLIELPSEDPKIENIYNKLSSTYTEPASRGLIELNINPISTRDLCNYN